MPGGNHSAVPQASFGIETYDSVHPGTFGRIWNKGVAKEIPFSFATQKDDYVTSFHDNYGFGEISSGATFTEFSATQKTATRAAFLRWGAILDVTFVEVDPDDGWIMFGKTNDPVQGRTTSWGYGPGGTTKDGDVWLATGGGPDLAGFAPGQYGHITLMHEIGHALGLKHPHAGGAYQMPSDGSDARDYLWFSIMSYKSTTTSDPDSGWSTSDGHYPQTPMLYDTYVTQNWYGANPALTGDDVYSVNATTCAVSKNGNVLWTPFTTKSLWCLADHIGDNSIDTTGYGSASIDLDEGEHSTLAAGQVAGNMPGSIQNAIGTLLVEGEEEPPAATGRIRLLGLRI
jgi:serralysin